MWQEVSHPWSCFTLWFLCHGQFWEELLQHCCPSFGKPPGRKFNRSKSRGPKRSLLTIFQKPSRFPSSSSLTDVETRTFHQKRSSVLIVPTFRALSAAQGCLAIKLSEVSLHLPVDQADSKASLHILFYSTVYLCSFFPCYYGSNDSPGIKFKQTFMCFYVNKNQLKSQVQRQVSSISSSQIMESLQLLKSNFLLCPPLSLWKPPLYTLLRFDDFGSHLSGLTQDLYLSPEYFPLFNIVAMTNRKQDGALKNGSSKKT